VVKAGVLYNAANPTLGTKIPEFKPVSNVFRKDLPQE